jgi:hypothetical protein
MKEERMQSFIFHFYFFIPKRKRDLTGNRPSLEQRSRALERIYERLDGENPPPILRDGRAIVHWQENLARNPQAEANPPMDRTMQQLMHVDNVNRRNDEDQQTGEEVLLSVEIGGAWTRLKFKKNELRQAVGLPDFDLVDVNFVRNNVQEIRSPTYGEREDSEHELEDEL